ncbi:MAG: outer membrane lipoprotein-sorting protein [Nitrospira sp.]|nr:outer membrane lipoprotein-sorting protein [Candidatus Manganitrophaceae bacterium]HIL35725.1 outer membrane lipoprotein-sorting protein [Candidatus Manganitrophaceae bacterium]
MKHFILFLFILLLFPITAFSESPEEMGLAIAVEADRRDNGFGDFTSQLKMVLTNRQGESSTRVIRNRTLEVKGDGDKSLIIFDNPRDVKGTAFLSFTHKVKNDDQWLFLPALKRVKRISSSNKSGSFMGSEFAYEDITSQEVEKYTYRWLRDEDYEGQLTFVIERDPVDPNSGYTRQVVWIDQAEYRPLKVDYYDRKNDLLKTLTYHGYQQYVGTFWRADRMQMVNHQTGKGTVLNWKNYKFKTGLTDRDFNKNSLKRAR